jgi:hypothetical protein
MLARDRTVAVAMAAVKARLLMVHGCPPKMIYLDFNTLPAGDVPANYPGAASAIRRDLGGKARHILGSRLIGSALHVNEHSAAD